MVSCDSWRIHPYRSNIGDIEPEKYVTGILTSPYHLSDRNIEAIAIPSYTPKKNRRIG